MIALHVSGKPQGLVTRAPVAAGATSPAVGPAGQTEPPVPPTRVPPCLSRPCTSRAAKRRNPMICSRPPCARTAAEAPVAGHAVQALVVHVVVLAKAKTVVEARATLLARASNAGAIAPPARTDRQPAVSLTR